MSYRLSNKRHVRDLVELCAANGVEDVVLSPGSRNAPFIISFTQHPDFNCLSIPDERSAAFVALGIAQQKRKPVAICCTSGSAALNYAPAIAEAYYQKVPLVVITADRPEHLIDNGDGQSIRQENVYANYIKMGVHLSETMYHPQIDLPKMIGVMQESIAPDFGPVHFNVALDEPLYEQRDWGDSPKPEVDASSVYPPLHLEGLLDRWNASQRKLILCGQHFPDEDLLHSLRKLAEDPSVVVLTENVANVQDDRFNPCVDRLIGSFSDEDKESFKPDILLTLGDAIVSKWVKKLFRQHPPAEHWNIATGALQYDMFGCLTRTIAGQPVEVLEALGSESKQVESDFANQWTARNKETREKHLQYVDQTKWSDLKAFEAILGSLPADSDVHLGNSTPVRYAQLFDQRMDVRYFSNRGVSGIDGSISTALGAALVTGRVTTMITGDVGFYYDSNALWSTHVPDNLRIILINNGGGGIFRFIPGPDTTDGMETYFETKQDLRAVNLAKTFGVDYRDCSNLESLHDGLTWLFRSEAKCSILEVITPAEENAVILRDYFENLK